jgi:hypothetical protein
MRVAAHERIEVTRDYMRRVRARAQSREQAMNLDGAPQLERPEQLRRELHAMDGQRRTTEGLRRGFDPFLPRPRRAVLIRSDDRPAADDHRVLASCRAAAAGAVRPDYAGDGVERLRRSHLRENGDIRSDRAHDVADQGLPSNASIKEVPGHDPDRHVRAS